MPIKIHGKQYFTVAERVNAFRDKHGDSGFIQTDVLQHDDVVLVKAVVGKYRNVVSLAKSLEGITEPPDAVCSDILGEGHAEEVRGSTQINTTSALENCETSAIGRALAAAGFGGTEYASANEVQNAIHQQDVTEQAKKAPQDVTFPNGQYIDETVAWVWEGDPAYVARIGARNDNHPSVLACQTYIAANQAAHDEKMAAIKEKKAAKAKEKQA